MKEPTKCLMCLKEIPEGDLTDLIQYDMKLATAYGNKAMTVLAKTETPDDDGRICRPCMWQSICIMVDTERFQLFPTGGFIGDDVGLTVAKAKTRKNMYDFIQDEFNNGEPITGKQHDAIKAMMVQFAKQTNVGLLSQVNGMVKANQERKERNRHMFGNKRRNKPTTPPVTP